MGSLYEDLCIPLWSHSSMQIPWLLSLQLFFFFWGGGIGGYFASTWYSFSVNQPITRRLKTTQFEETIQFQIQIMTGSVSNGRFCSHDNLPRSHVCKHSICSIVHIITLFIKIYFIGVERWSLLEYHARSISSNLSHPQYANSDFRHPNM